MKTKRVLFILLALFAVQVSLFAQEKKMTRKEKDAEIAKLEKAMREAAKMMEYEYAAVLRDQIIELRK